MTKMDIVVLHSFDKGPMDNVEIKLPIGSVIKKVSIYGADVVLHVEVPVESSGEEIHKFYCIKLDDPVIREGFAYFDTLEIFAEPGQVMCMHLCKSI